MSDKNPQPSAFSWDNAWMSHRDCLPHLRQSNALYFVTFRLADSLPESKLKLLRERRDAWQSKNPPPHSKEQNEEYRKIWTGPIERMLDASHGGCVLKNVNCRNALEHTLRHGDGKEYELGDFVIMPNHVHLLIHVLPGQDLSALLQAWKSISSHRINKHLKRVGTLWLEEYFDHIVRNEGHWSRFVAYIRKNPVRLRREWHTLGLGSLQCKSRD